MSPFQAADAILIAQLGQPLMYSRPMSARFSPVTQFALTGIIETGAEYADPNGPLEADLFIQVAAISFGPQKGDQVTFPAPTNMRTGTYLVQSIFYDQNAGSAHLKLRWASA